MSGAFPVLRIADGLSIRCRTARSWALPSRSSTSSTAISEPLKPTSAMSNGTSVSDGACSSSSDSCGVKARTSSILSPNAAAGELRLSSAGTSRYRELEATTRYLGGERRDITRLVRLGERHRRLNSYDQFFGNLRNPIIRANENNLIPTDVRHRLLVRGTFGLPGQWDFAPLLELRSGFPWSAVNEFQDFVGPRSLAGRLPAVHTLDFTLARPWRFRKYRFRAGLKLYNVFGASAERDVQNNVTSPDYGRFFNPIERSIGFVFGSAR